MKKTSNHYKDQRYEAVITKRIRRKLEFKHFLNPDTAARLQRQAIDPAARGFCRPTQSARRGLRGIFAGATGEKLWTASLRRGAYGLKPLYYIFFHDVSPSTLVLLSQLNQLSSTSETAYFQLVFFSQHEPRIIQHGHGFFI